MDKTMQSSLCQGIRACGLPKEFTLELVNTIVKWYDSNGVEWTNDRLKALKQWYISALAGNPEPPAYFRKSKNNLPVGVFGRLFKVSDQAKVLAVLSANTLFKESELSATQRNKFTKALEGDVPHVHRQVPKSDLETLRLVAQEHNPERHRRRFPGLSRPTLEDMTGQSIPISSGKNLRVNPQTQLDDRRKAFLESWRSLSQPVLDYLDREDKLDWIPDAYAVLRGSWGGNQTRKPCDSVGRIGLIQEPALKLRSVANPNRIAQALTLPLAGFWEWTMKQFPSDCTFDQESGTEWVQRKLAAGVELAGSDLSSATDLLDLDCCLQLAWEWSRWYLANDPESLERYDLAVNYFYDLSRSQWDTPERSHLGKVTWKQGQPLGLYPSFRLLAITNNALGVIAACKNSLDPDDSFRVIGDDIIMDARMENDYTRMVEAMGGEINHSKTVRSAKVAEFAGRIITPTRIMRKTYKYRDPSDDSFMEIMKDLGPQAVGFLARRQRKQWETFKFVPGIAYRGPWSQDSFGEPLIDRVAWAEIATSLFEEASRPDPETVSEEQQMLRLVAETQESEGTGKAEVLRDLPWPVDEDLQSSRISAQARPSGDPRRKNGLSTLERLENVQKQPGFQPYPQFKKKLRPLQAKAETEAGVSADLVTKPSAPSVPSSGQIEKDGPTMGGMVPPVTLPDSRSATGTCKGPAEATPRSTVVVSPEEATRRALEAQRSRLHGWCASTFTPDKGDEEYSLNHD